MSATVTNGIHLEFGGGPVTPICCPPSVGLESEDCWKCVTVRDGAHRARMLDIDRVIQAGDRLRYAVLPEFRPDRTGPERYASCAVSLDLRFDDGSRLGGLRPTGSDQYGTAIGAEAQFRSDTLVPDQWNLKVVDLSIAVGQRVVGIDVETWAGEPFSGVLTAWIDAVTVGPDVGPTRDPDHPSDWVRTTRGSHSSYLYSRGNTAPAVGLPHGFMMASPMTRAWQGHWIYTWCDNERPGPLVLDNSGANTDRDVAAVQQPARKQGPTQRIQAFATTLIPSPWIGERASFQVMPTTSDGIPDPDRFARELPFDHANELDRPYHYRVAFDNGVVGELAPAQHSIAMRFTFPPGLPAALILDQLDSDGAVEIAVHDGGATITGWSDAVLERVPVVPRLFVNARLRGVVVGHGQLPQPDRGGTAYLRMSNANDASDRQTVELMIGTSFISTEQAARNLELDIGTHRFDAVRDAARNRWDDALGVVSVSGASPDQRITLYSNLYRLLLYPNVMHEPTPGGPAYASPFAPPPKPHTAHHTGLPVVPGELTVNQGYWDTYRTSWPALQLLDPSAGRLLDGVVQHFRDSGWTTRWSAPGHVDVMVGTSSDVIVADAAVKRTPGFDLVAAYDSALRNATVPPPVPAVGRKGLRHSIFRGWTPVEVAEGLSWTIEAAINDFGLHTFSELMADVGPIDRRAEFRANTRYFGSRALSYSLLFDPDIDFFQGRCADGSFRLAAAEYDPATWGHDYTETNGWGMAFSVPQDGSGLAALYGGREGLARKLDAFFSTPEVGGDAVRGSYDYPIHEITEARDMRLGMLGLSNQPAHHIPMMYLFAGRPDATQRIVRECLRRLYLGSEIGQGYPGDEDNGEMSTWWTFNALGFYPLVVGRPGYVITSPLFNRVTIVVAGGGTFTVTADGNSPENVYIAAATLDGEEWNTVWLPHERVLAGGELRLTMSPVPTSWGADSSPPSLTADGQKPVTLVDLTGSAETSLDCPGDPAVLVDDSSDTVVDLAPGTGVGCHWATPVHPALYTVTPAAVGTANWVVQVRSADDQEWRTVDRQAAVFQWGRQTRAFEISGSFTDLRLQNTGSAPLSLAQFELLA
ncbi:putative alpha-1,2-mannosidase [Nakamurella sp. UYEF19]|uniref:GH92 family glycosyl hydrolase n=1 Tax=Nakamurella sp. UYEF19 TaxID=1756392 RepID=UPI00339808A5